MNAVATPNLVGITGIARRLVQDGALTEAAAREAMTGATDARKPLATYLTEKRLVAPAHLAAANSIEFGVPLFDAAAMDPDQSAVKLVNEELLRKHRVLPLFRRGNRLFVGIAEPTNTHALAEIKFQTNFTIEAILVDEESIKRHLDRWLESADALGDAMGGDDEGLENLDVGGDDDLADDGVEAKTDDTPVVKFINKVLVDAIRRGASDIHFEPYETEYRVRLRIDGLLKQAARVPVKLQARISARLKVMAQLDIAEKRVPQDGRIKLNLSKTKQIDFRVSTLPTLFGEKIVLRILDGSAARLGIEKLGYEDDQRDLFLAAVKRPYGMVLVTGPTGSGKTVSLYTALNILNDETRNISTVEDPVEIRVPGINQVQMNPKRGMTFAAALRSFLR
ncbi:MAG TPA: ATPase, T2SS/T4P/T4SS family, partial [Lysobacter sp.]|nr:ATPase, T2SS/T4P/T4SS family [Lysobacter sp.]